MPPASLTTPTRVAMTLDIKPELVAEYKAAHASPRPEVVCALRSVGLRNLSLWTSGVRLFYYAEFVPTRDGETFDEAMARYATLPGVQQWEDDMHKYQQPIPGTDEKAAVWWQVMDRVYYQI